MKKYLLDTQTLLWALFNSKHLTNDVKDIIISNSTDIFISVVSLWEIDLKHSIDPDNLGVTSDVVLRHAYESGYSVINLIPEHIFTVNNLIKKPDSEKHKDPFDRIILAQSKYEDMTLITSDGKLGNYYDEAILSFKKQ